MRDELKKKALSFPKSPGIYQFIDKTGEIIYIGKAKVLKNRISQYFQDWDGLSLKVRHITSRAADIKYIVTASELDAFMLECRLIRLYKPRYNTLLKDSGGYPFVRIDMREEYPVFEMTQERRADGADYFGPFGGGWTTMMALEKISEMFCLPQCGKVFPRDIGKTRPCLHYQVGRCFGPCRPEADPAEYRAAMEQAHMLFSGKYEPLAEKLRAEMETAAEELEFERAAELRNRLAAVERFGYEQQTVFFSKNMTDAVGYHIGDSKLVVSVLFIRGGNVTEQRLASLALSSREEARELFADYLKQFYPGREPLPEKIIVPHSFEDMDLLAQVLSGESGRNVRFVVPKSGANLKLLKMAEENAATEAKRITTIAEKSAFSLSELARMAGLPSPPERIEAYDISNTGKDSIVGSMVVFSNARPDKAEYRKFSIREIDGPNDYAAMAEMLRRRVAHLGDKAGAFSRRPDLILIDGGHGHASASKAVLDGAGEAIPLLGMVKDARHSTRALVTPAGEEIGISTNPPVFALIGSIQNEAHRFAVTFHRAKKAAKTVASSLEKIEGIGKARSAALLKHFKSVKKIREATEEELAEAVPAPAARAVFLHFHPEEE